VIRGADAQRYNGHSGEKNSNAVNSDPFGKVLFVFAFLLLVGSLSWTFGLPDFIEGQFTTYDWYCASVSDGGECSLKLRKVVAAPATGQYSIPLLVTLYGYHDYQESTYFPELTGCIVVNRKNWQCDTEDERTFSQIQASISAGIPETNTRYVMIDGSVTNDTGFANVPGWDIRSKPIAWYKWWWYYNMYLVRGLLH